MVTLQELVQATKSERAAEAFLLKKGVLVRYRSCPWCGGRRVWRVRRGGYKCGQCRREWSARRGSVLEDTRVDLVTFVLAVKLFSLEVSAHRAAKELGLAYNTTHKLFMKIRQALVAKVEEGAQKAAGEVEMDEAYFGGKRRGKRGRGAAGKIPVFGILQRGGKVRVEILPDVSSESLLRLAVAKVKRGSLIYTDQFKGYDGLVSYGFRHQRIDKTTRFANGRVYLNGIEGFWSFAKERLAKFHGVGKDNFILYLKELEFRYNHRENLDDAIYQALRGGTK